MLRARCVEWSNPEVRHATLRAAHETSVESCFSSSVQQSSTNLNHFFAAKVDRKSSMSKSKKKVENWVKVQRVQQFLWTYRFLKVFQPFRCFLLGRSVWIIIQIVNISQNYFNFRFFHFFICFPSRTLLSSLLSLSLVDDIFNVCRLLAL